MARETKLHAVENPPAEQLRVPDDAADIEALWFDPKLGDGIVDVTLHSVEAIGTSGVRCGSSSWYSRSCAVRMS
jgi:hypothetical protein